MRFYLRYYCLNLWRIGSPYSFTPLGSGIALPVWAYRAIGGITPHKSGEDFYFLQKLRKFGEVLPWNREKVYPSGRYSDRVFFGTGPALIKGRKGDWESYPVYDYRLFDQVEATYKLFPRLFISDVPAPMTSFLHKQFSTKDLWQPLRENYKTVDQFVNACHRQVDGLRILQYLKSHQQPFQGSNEINLVGFLRKFYQMTDIESFGIDLENFSFESTPVLELNALRNFLAEKEEVYQLAYMKAKKFKIS